jgi:hypothetical protein
MNDKYSLLVFVVFAAIGVLRSPKVLLLLLAVLFIGHRSRRRGTRRG